jgi:hypothetical protein
VSQDTKPLPPLYRVWLRGALGAIEGRDEFAAANPEQAFIIAKMLADACSDHCATFDLWQGDRLLAGNQKCAAGADLFPFAALRRKVEEFSQTLRETLIERLEMIRDSNWAVARSRRLLRRLAEMRDWDQAPPRALHYDRPGARKHRPKPTLLDDWDVVRAAQHMIEVHGPQATVVAERRAEMSDDVTLMRRWRAIGSAVSALARSRAH